MFTYKTRGTCSTQIQIDAKDGIIDDVQFTRGCSGNLSGISLLVKGMKVDDAIERLHGVRCGDKPTSCPDQLAKALLAMKAQEATK